ncbi:hypothetical protein KSD_28660 [Ktedonobacter sp. SOSP1-85]|uniref:hypothetical protein n=1 Tax=Ktedonobacter sp. SOSP1-85 TaxID=2778367 RepID=UPI001915E9FB|nr:hypothetical protein [Ktedonobacter sp. SOSP1-85]GHO75095.1 hypothetical protein KSD_28660 [Ktedonobacter sp. SOSP1-85]
MQATMAVPVDTEPPLYPGGQEIDRFFDQYDSYISLQAQRRFSRKNSMARAETYDLDVDDVKQSLRLHCWLVLRQHTIENPRAYISRAAFNETVSLARQYKPCSQLTLDDDGELFQGNISQTFHTSNQDPDPAEVVEHNEDATHWLELAINAIVQLPQTQRYAMLSSIKERFDDPQQLRAVCYKHNIDLDDIQWPEHPVETQRLRASLSVARKNKTMQHLRLALQHKLENPAE